MTFESEGLLIYIWLPPASYIVFLTTLVCIYLGEGRGDGCTNACIWEHT